MNNYGKATDIASVMNSKEYLFSSVEPLQNFETKDVTGCYIYVITDELKSVKVKIDGLLPDDVKYKVRDNVDFIGFNANILGQAKFKHGVYWYADGIKLS